MSGANRLSELEKLIAEFEKSDLRELQARVGDMDIYLSKEEGATGLDVSTSVGMAPAQVARPAASAQAAAPEAAAPAVQSVPDGAVVVCAPYLGTFYRAPKPGADPYVEVGDRVSAESELCLVEVMKLFTAVRAGVAGTIVQVLANDGDLVPADHPLFAVQPD